MSERNAIEVLRKAANEAQHSYDDWRKGELFTQEALEAVAAVDALYQAAKDERVMRDLLWMADGRKKSDRAHVDALAAAVSRVEGTA